ncbi:hypothetical protein J4470_03395 [Candidatus Woesearchaeota archaeon]|nr:hypothetical protein [Candidatus Woesearchaeota archaeon]
MRHVKYSLFVFMIIALFASGIIGFSNFESMTTKDAFHSTVAALTFSSNSSGFSEQGKLLNSALALASVAVIVWAFANFHFRGDDVSHHATEYFKFLPKDEGLVLKEIKIAAKSRLSGMKKLEVLQKTGTVVMAVKKGNAFQLNVPFDAKLAANSKVLVMGTLPQIKEVEKEAKK